MAIIELIANYLMVVNNNPVIITYIVLARKN